MKKILGLTWVEWVCIIAACLTGEIVTSSFQLTGFTEFIVWMIGWICGYGITLYIIKKILEWKGKN